MSSESEDESNTVRKLRGRTISIEQTQKKTSKSKPNPFSALKVPEESETPETDSTQGASSSTQPQTLPITPSNESSSNLAHSIGQQSELEAPIIEGKLDNPNPVHIKIETSSSDEANTEESANEDRTSDTENRVIDTEADNQINKINQENPNNEEDIMAVAFSLTNLSEVIPKVTDEKSLEHFVFTVDNLVSEITELQKPLFLVIVKSRIVGKAYQAIKGKTFANWEEIKTTLQTHLEMKIDYSTALNRLTRITQKYDETLKAFIERIRDALGVLNKVTAKDIPQESRAQVILINDATAKNTFEAGIKNQALKTVTIAAQKATFVDSYSFASNQEQTNFPSKDKKEDSKKTEEKTIVCFKCNKVGHRAFNCFKSNSPPRRDNGPPNVTRSNSYNGPNSYKSFDNTRSNSYQNLNQNSRSNNHNYQSRENYNNYQRSAANSQSFNRNNPNGFSSRPTNGWNNNNNQTRQNRPNYEQRSQSAMGHSENRNANIRTVRETELDWDEISPANVTETGN